LCASASASHKNKNRITPQKLNAVALQKWLAASALTKQKIQKMAAGGVPQFASLYVGDLHTDVTEAMLYEVFNSVGPVGSIRVCRDSVTRRSLGYGYVNFHSVGDAERALDTLNYSSIKGRSCRIMWSQRDPSLRKSGAGNVFVKNLDPNIDNKALYDTFSLFGNILSCKVSSDINGKSRGYGFVHYETEEAATQAISKVNGMQIGEKTVEVSLFLARNDRETTDAKNFSNLYVKHFPADWDEEKIKELFSPMGTITSQCVMTDSRGRKFAFVNYETQEAAAKAVETLHNKEMRSEDEKKADDEAEKEMELGPDKLPLHLLYVGRAQSKNERLREMRDKASPDGKAGQAQGVNLYVKNLDEATDDAQLRELFEPFGKVTSVSSMVDDKGKCKGFGFVCFELPDEATKAVTEMHLKVVKGKPLYVGLAEKREARQERLRQRYTAGGSGGKGSGGKGGKGAFGGGGGKGEQGGFGGGFGGMQGGMMGGMQGGMMPQQMMGMMRPQGMQGMMMPQMMGKGMPGMPQMMGGPQMMGKGAPMGMMNPQMMAMMQGKGAMPGQPGMGMMGKGMPGMMPGMMGMRPPMGQMPGQPGMGMRPQMQPQPQSQPSGPGAPLTAAALAAAPPAVQKQLLGEKLFPAIQRFQPEFAGKITGMMLEMDNSELLILLESEAQLKNKVDEAMRVLEVQK